MTHARTVVAETGRFVELRRRLLTLHPDLEDQVLLDTLEGASALPEALEALIGSALEDEAMANSLKTLIEQMRARLTRLLARAGSKRQCAVEAMEVAGLRKLQRPAFTATLRAGTAQVLVAAEDRIPAAYWAPQPPRLNRGALRDALMSGHRVPGASLSEPRPVLSVRVV